MMYRWDLISHKFMSSIKADPHHIHISITCFGRMRITEATIIAQGAVEIAILLDGTVIGKEHAQHGDVLVVVLGLLNALCSNGFALQMQARLHARTEHVDVGHVD